MSLKKLVKTLTHDISLPQKLMLYTSVTLYLVLLLLGLLIFNRAIGILSDMNEQSVHEQLQSLDEAIRSRLENYQSVPSTLIIDQSFQDKLAERPREFGDALDYDEEIFNYVSSISSRTIVAVDWTIYFNGEQCGSRYRNIKSASDASGEEWLEDLKSQKLNRLVWSFAPSQKKNASCEFVCVTGVKNRTTREIPAYFRMTVSISFVSERLRQTAERVGGTILMLDGDGNILWRSCDEYTGYDEYIYSYFSGGESSGGFDISTIESKHFGYTLVCLRDSMAPSLRYISFSRYFLVVTLVIMAFSFLMLLASSRLIGRRITDLAGSIRSVDESTLEFDVDLTGKDEAGELSRAFSSLLDRIRSLIERDRQLEAERFELEIKALQSQINPHFLFNTLSIINLLAQEIEADNISESIEALANFYRLSLNNGEKLITVRDELEIIDNYLKICSIRYRGRLCVARDIDPRALDCVIPKLIIQPFLENSVFHGFSPYAAREPVISITVRRYGNELTFLLEDNGEGMTEEELQKALSGGFAISNVRRRIEMLYGKNGGVTITTAPGHGTAVMIRLLVKMPEDGARI